MNLTCIKTANDIASPQVADGASADADSKWYAVQTRSRHEKSVSQQLRCRNVDVFLPTYGAVHRWKNGDHNVELPLFPGYTFVRIALKDRLQVLKVPGSVRLVGVNGRPIPLDVYEFENLRNGVNNGIKAQPHPFLVMGRRVRIMGGPLRGCKGIMIRKRNNIAVVISVDLIRRSIQVEIDPACIEPD